MKRSQADRCRPHFETGDLSLTILVTVTSFRYFLLDLDGTVAESHEGICWAAAESFKLVLPSIAIPDFRPHIGPPIGTMFKQVLSERHARFIPELIRSYRMLYDNEGFQKARLYPGVADIMNKWIEVGCFCAIVTNKPILPARRMVESLGIKSLIADVCSPDSGVPAYESKGTMAMATLGKLGWPISLSVFVGDSFDDSVAAQFCGIDFIAATYGYGKVHERIACGLIISNFLEMHRFTELKKQK